MGNQISVSVKADDITKLLEILSQKGYRVIGPTVSDNAIVLDEIASVDQLPIGIVDQQDGGKYRLEKTAGNSLFAFVHGQHSWKKFIFPPVQKLWEAQKAKTGFKLLPNGEPDPKLALLGVRACELKAIQIHDKVFTEGPYKAPAYNNRRNNILIIAVNCTRASGTCFCVSMNTGPKVESGYDLALTEIISNNNHYFVIDSGSEIGAEIIAEIPNTQATENDLKAADKAIKQAADQMGRQLNTDSLNEIISRNFEHPHWDTIAERCLSCCNCTMVCPTCFCATIEDTTDLTGTNAVRIRKWDSCFTLDFSYIYGGSIRESAMSRYRQWMSHKLSAWVDQFGTYGCVGCGRCITWCPVGIDITEEARFIRENDLVEDALKNKKDVKDGNA